MILLGKLTLRPYRTVAILLEGRQFSLLGVSASKKKSRFDE